MSFGTNFSTDSYFNPRSPHGERQEEDDFQAPYFAHFNPRSPHGERHLHRCLYPPEAHFNPRSPHGERRQNIPVFIRPIVISTHAPRTGSDDGFPVGEDCGSSISTHAPRTGSDVVVGVPCCCCVEFQPTLPARGATRRAVQKIKPPTISTHAPRTGSDQRQATPPWG